jgi:hypothetical protein
MAQDMARESAFEDVVLDGRAIGKAQIVEPDCLCVDIPILHGGEGHLRVRFVNTCGKSTSPRGDVVTGVAPKYAP